MHVEGRRFAIVPHSLCCLLQVALPLLLAVTPAFLGCSGSGGGPTAPSSQSGKTRVPASGEERTVAVGFGDSITHGRDGDVRGMDSAIGGYIPTLRQMLEDSGRDVRLIEEGEPGTDTNDGVIRIDRVLERRGPDLVLIMYGTNDEYEGLPKGVTRHKSLTIDNLRYMVQRCRAAGAEPIVGTLPCVCGSHAWMEDDVEEVNDLIRAMAAQERVRVADVHRAFQRNGGCALIGETGNHPTDEGYRVVAETFFGCCCELVH